MRVEAIDPDGLSDARYAVYLEDKLAFKIGFKLFSLVNNTVYVTLEPCEALERLKPAHFRYLRQRFNEFSYYNFFCQVDSQRNARFARFFGFREVGMIWGRIHMVKESS